MSLINDAIKRASTTKPGDSSNTASVASFQPVETAPVSAGFNFATGGLLAVGFCALLLGGGLWLKSRSATPASAPAISNPAPAASIPAAAPPAPAKPAAPLASVLQESAATLQNVQRLNAEGAAEADKLSTPAPAAPSVAVAPALAVVSAPAATGTVPPPPPAITAVQAAAPTAEAPVISASAAKPVSEPEPVPAVAEAAEPVVEPAALEPAPLAPSEFARAAAKAAQSANPENPRLQAIYYRLKGPTVVINGKTLAAGQAVGGVKVTAIQRNSVEVEVAGARRMLTLQ